MHHKACFVIDTGHRTACFLIYAIYVHDVSSSQLFLLVTISTFLVRKEGQFLVLPHKEVGTYVERKAADRDRWLVGMQRLQARMLGNPKL
jgi:hypothetical protein